MNLLKSPTFKLLAFSMLPGIGPSRLRRLAQMKDFAMTPVEDLSKEVKAIEKAFTIPSAWAIAVDLAAKQIDAAETAGARIISILDSEYPRLLSLTKDDPVILYVKGVLTPAATNSVAIIGTRKPTAHGEIITSRVTEFFVENKWSVVSGLALGCDALAHRTALHINGHTVAVLAHGLQTIAPKQHQHLADQILEKGGALVTEYCFGQEVHSQQFVKRDRIQAGLANGVVMIQSDLEGGSMHASRAAIDYGRWLAIPYPTKEDLAWNQSKIQANLLLSIGEDKQKAELLRCDEASLAKIHILRGREDYPYLISKLNNLDVHKGAHIERVMNHDKPEKSGFNQLSLL